MPDGSERTGWVTSALLRGVQVRYDPVYNAAVSDEFKRVIGDIHARDAVLQGQALMDAEGVYDTGGVYVTGESYYRRRKRWIGVGEQSWFYVKVHFRGPGRNVASLPAGAIRLDLPGLPETCYLSLCEVRLRDEVQILNPRVQ